jgi:hypothetical protein
MENHSSPKDNAAKHVQDPGQPSWVQRHPVTSVLLGVPMMAFGVGVSFGGLVLRDGNLSGRFVTFPFAGALTIMAGVFLLVIGLDDCFVNSLPVA